MGSESTLRTPDLRALLNAVQAAPPVDAVEVLARELATMIGADDVSFLIADFTGDALIRFLCTPAGSSRHDSTHSEDHLSTVPLLGSPHDHALRSQQVLVEHDGGVSHLYAPVTDRGDALGVLELALCYPPDDDILNFVASAAHALAYVIIANRRHTDLYERGQRSIPFSLAAEIQRRLLPASFTCEAAQFTVAGWLEPAASMGGDTFDYSLERDMLHLSITDAMGHTVNSSLLATLAVGSLRNSRRAETNVVDKARAANAAILANAGEDDFVSGLLLNVDLATGVAAVVNAGHPSPYLVKDGDVTRIQLSADLPFGMLREGDYHEQTLRLTPGDRIVLVTDGMLERNATTLDIAAALEGMVELHPREVVHSFARAVLGATGGELQDDATVVCLDWYGPQPGGGERIAQDGASQSRASGTREEA